MININETTPSDNILKEDGLEFPFEDGNLCKHLKQVSAGYLSPSVSYSSSSLVTFSEETLVTFSPLSPSTIQEYVLTGEPMDKSRGIRNTRKRRGSSPEYHWLLLQSSGDFPSIDSAKNSTD